MTRLRGRDTSLFRRFGAARLWCCGAAMLLLGAHRGEAQRVLRGVVADSGGRPVVGADVLIVAGADSLRARSGVRGEWSVSTAVPPHEIAVRAFGFQRVTIRAPFASSPLLVTLRPTLVSLASVVVTASRREQRLADVPVTTELISRADIERTGAADVSDVLARETGMTLEGGVGAGVGVMLQGLGSERVLVLVDGQPVTGRIAGQLDVSRFPASPVDRIEIVKGAQSTLYGSEAMGGVVNIVTRRPSPGASAARAAATIGSQSRRDLSGGAGFSIGTWAFDVDAGHRGNNLTPGRDATSGSLTARRHLSTRAVWARDTARTLDLSLTAIEQRLRWRSGALYAFSDDVQLGANVRARMATGAGTFTGSGATSVFDHLSRASSEMRPIAGDTGQRIVQSTMAGELLYSASPSISSTVDAGLRVQREAARSARVPGGMRQAWAIEPFAQLELRPASALTIVPGARLSWRNEWGTYLAPRLALRWRLRDALTLRAAAGTGYRAPSFNERLLFFQNAAAGYAVLGNPDLRPEQSRSFTLGWELSREQFYARTQLFRTQFLGFIEARAVSAPGAAIVYRYENVDRGYTMGAEIEAGSRVAGISLESSLALLRARDTETNRELLGRPPLVAKAIASTSLARTEFSATALLTSRTPIARSANGIISYREAFPRFDLRIARPLAFGAQLSAVAENVANRRPNEWSGFAGRRLSLSLSWSGQRTRT